MFKRQRAGSVVCVSCGYLVGVNDAKCYHCGRRNPGLWGFAPALRSLGSDLGFVPFVTTLCIIVYGLTLVTSGAGVMSGGPLSFLAPSGYSLILFGASGSYPVFDLGRWWTVLSASWLHGGLLHILFNLLWIRQLAPEVGELYGPGRMIVIYTIAGICGFTASSVAGYELGFLPIRILQGAQLTIGASAPIFGLLGAVVYYGRRTGSRATQSNAWMWAIAMFIFGLVMPGVDNYAHAGGFAGGYLASVVLDPLKPERIDHMLMAVVCLGLSVLSIVVSVLHGLALR
ncbi:MAG TPA: rhomboid family intramembrane serine protease [Vicinamibacterales bacterium]|jgi:rhomboid protease GluP|nr:rhomboid family intramembrane serine protease [Vicinamibacterales bacterium]